ncbi:hypothetical protein CVG52_18800 [Acinetobacter baumannii]|uniref:hypothetical protein n=1 Tax=Acinetobacter baumannii TaxID=470 RepID=UPI00122F6FDF|nr:hypothetical protein [Acinetobacter baumannii]KAA3494232.1 hypothetical protein CVG52_18800 [Acinetobacter baumannii]MBD0141391.1 hypothetical protein [Acinetobacter baumannii]
MEQEILKKHIEYLHSCYFLWLERPTDPLDLSPPKSYGEDIVIGHHIKTVKRLRRWFKKNELPEPLFDSCTVYETIGKLRLQ